MDKNKPAYPKPMSGFTYSDGSYECEPGESGVTIRQYYAAKAMQAMLTSRLYSGTVYVDSNVIAKDAFAIADAMIEYENKNQE